MLAIALPARAQSPGHVAIIGVTVIDPDAEEPARVNQTIVIEGNVIRRVGDNREVRASYTSSGMGSTIFTKS